MNPDKLKKLQKLAKVLDGGDVELLTQLDKLESKVESDIRAIHAVVTEALAVAETTKKLEGKKGEKGKSGNDGKDGKNGRDGKDGKDGESGKDGKDGFVDEAMVGYLEGEVKRIDRKSGLHGQTVRKIRAGKNISVDETNMEYPIITGTNPKITVGDTPPTDPDTGDLWIDTNAYTYRAVTSTYTITLEDYMLDCNGTFTITLPTAVGFSGEYIIKNTGDGLVTLEADGSETIDGDDYMQLIRDEVTTLRSTGTSWLIV